MPESEEDGRLPVQVTLTVAGDHEDRASVHLVADALAERLAQADLEVLVSYTLTTKIKKGAR